MKLERGENSTSTMRTVETYSDKTIQKELTKDFALNMTEVASLSILADKIPQENSSTRLATNILYKGLTEMQDAINHGVARIAKDRTITVAKKVIEREALVEKHFKAMEQTINRAVKESLSEHKDISSKLFSSDLALSPLETNMMPAMLEHAKTSDFGLTIDSTNSPSEAKLALVLSRDFRALVKMEGSTEELVRHANTIFTPEEQNMADAIKDVGTTVHGMAKKFNQMKSDFVNPDMVSYLKGERNE